MPVMHQSISAVATPGGEFLMGKNPTPRAEILCETLGPRAEEVVQKTNPRGTNFTSHKPTDLPKNRNVKSHFL